MEQFSSNKSSTKMYLGLGTLGVFTLVALGILIAGKNSNQDVATNPVVNPVTTPVTTPTVTPVATPDTTTVTPPVTTPTQSSIYKNGTYTAQGTYDSPAGTERIGITVTLQNDVITAASAVNEANARQSVRYQNAFISGFQPLVIGKNIDQVSLDRVAGSSLTPAGFNDALDKIKTQAHA